MPVRRHRLGALAALIDTAAAAGSGTVGTAGSTPRAAPGAAPPEANPSPRRWPAAALALLPLVACACVGNTAAASPPASLAPALYGPEPAPHPAKLHHSPRYRQPPLFVMISVERLGNSLLCKLWRTGGTAT